MTDPKLQTGASRIDPRPVGARKTIPVSEGDREDENIVDLIGHLTQQSAHLAQQQISLVQAEMREAVDDLKQAVGAALGAAVLGIAGLGVTLMGISYVIGDAIGDRDIATLLVGIVVLIIAAILYASARKKLAESNIKPERTIETAERTPDAATGNLTHSGATR